jgi:TetR/AcrR family transcriptional repressor of nem operon
VTDTPLRERILDAANDLVLDQGFSATTVDAVLTRAGASKGAFFHHFPTKTALGTALVERYAAADLAQLERGMAAAEATSDDPAEQLIAFVRGFEDEAVAIASAQSGCLFVSFIYESVEDSDEIRAIIVKTIEAWRQRILEKLTAVAAARDLPADVDLPSMADAVYSAFEGGFVLARATGDPVALRDQLAHLRRYYELALRPS